MRHRHQVIVLQNPLQTFAELYRSNILDRFAQHDLKVLDLDIRQFDHVCRNRLHSDVAGGGIPLKTFDQAVEQITSRAVFDRTHDNRYDDTVFLDALNKRQILFLASVNIAKSNRILSDLSETNCFE